MCLHIVSCLGVCLFARDVYYIYTVYILYTIILYTVIITTNDDSCHIELRTPECACVSKLSNFSIQHSFINLQCQRVYEFHQ